MHLYGSFTESHVSLFINGHEVGSKPCNQVCPKDQSDWIVGSPGFCGMIQEVRLWKSHSFSGDCGQEITRRSALENQSDLVGVWKFMTYRDPEINTVFDLSYNAVHAQIAPGSHIIPSCGPVNRPSIMQFPVGLANDALTHQNASISKDGLTVRPKGEALLRAVVEPNCAYAIHREIMLASVGVKRGVHVWQFHVEGIVDPSGSPIRIGIMRPSCDSITLEGDYSYCIRSDGKKSHNNSPQDYTSGFCQVK